MIPATPADAKRLTPIRLMGSKVIRAMATALRTTIKIII